MFCFALVVSKLFPNADLSGVKLFEYQKEVLQQMGWKSIKFCEKADGEGGCSRHRRLKRRTRRRERRRAKFNPECLPAYGRYRGWEL